MLDCYYCICSAEYVCTHKIIIILVSNLPFYIVFSLFLPLCVSLGEFQIFCRSEKCSSFTSLNVVQVVFYITTITLYLYVYFEAILTMTQAERVGVAHTHTSKIYDHMQSTHSNSDFTYLIQVSRTWMCVSVKQVQIEMFGLTVPWHSEIFDQQSHTLTNTYAGCSATLFFNYFIYKKTISHEFNNGAIQAHKLNALNECSQFSKYPVLFPSLCRILAYSLFRDVIHVDILCMVCV